MVFHSDIGSKLCELLLPRSKCSLLRYRTPCWYNESINVGHADLRHASWWPKLTTPENLTSILTTIIWLASTQHAALNFGQYPYNGYDPTQPPLMRQLMPKEHDPGYTNFVKVQQRYFLSSLPSWSQITKYMAVIDIISSHLPDKEYLGMRKDLSTWSDPQGILQIFNGDKKNWKGDWEEKLWYKP